MKRNSHAKIGPVRLMVFAMTRISPLMRRSPKVLGLLCEHSSIQITLDFSQSHRNRPVACLYFWCTLSTIIIFQLLPHGILLSILTFTRALRARRGTRRMLPIIVMFLCDEGVSKIVLTSTSNLDFVCEGCCCMRKMVAYDHQDFVIIRR